MPCVSSGKSHSNPYPRRAPTHTCAPPSVSPWPKGGSQILSKVFQPSGDILCLLSPVPDPPSPFPASYLISSLSFLLLSGTPPSCKAPRISRLRPLWLLQWPSCCSEGCSGVEQTWLGREEGSGQGRGRGGWAGQAASPSSPGQSYLSSFCKP